VPYARLVQLIRVTREAALDERRWQAFWSWRANPPTVGEGKDRRVIPFGEWWDRMTGKVQEYEPAEISDEEIEQALKMGRMQFRPPGG
jgi:hypothetical protein